MEKESLAGELQIHNVNKWYPGKVHAVIDMNMEINQGEFIVFIHVVAILRFREREGIPKNISLSVKRPGSAV